MTEACGFLSLAFTSDPVDTRINTGGHPLPGMEARICDPETYQVLPPGGIGKSVKGPNTSTVTILNWNLQHRVSMTKVTTSAISAT